MEQIVPWEPSNEWEKGADRRFFERLSYFIGILLLLFFALSKANWATASKMHALECV